MIRFIDEYRNRFSVEFICKTLKNNRAGGFITSRGYRQSKARGVSALERRYYSAVAELFGGCSRVAVAPLSRHHHDLAATLKRGCKQV